MTKTTLSTAAAGSGMKRGSLPMETLIWIGLTAVLFVILVVILANKLSLLKP